MEEVILKMKGIAAVLEHMSSSTDNVRWNNEAIMMLNEELESCIEELEQM